MKLPAKKAPPRKRNLAAKALADPAFRPKVVADPRTYRRIKKVVLPPDEPEDDA